MTAADKAIEDRKRQIREEMSESLKERDKESERQKLQETEDMFQALLVDLVSHLLYPRILLFVNHVKSKQSLIVPRLDQKSGFVVA